MGVVYPQQLFWRQRRSAAGDAEKSAAQRLERYTGDTQYVVLGDLCEVVVGWMSRQEDDRNGAVLERGDGESCRKAMLGIRSVGQRERCLGGLVWAGSIQGALPRLVEVCGLGGLDDQTARRSNIHSTSASR